MKPIINPWFIYLAGACDEIREVVGFLFLIFEGFNLIQKSPDKSSSTSTDVSTQNEDISDGEKVNS